MRKKTKLQDGLIKATKQGLRPREVLDFRQIPEAIRPELVKLLSDLRDYALSKIKEGTNTATRFDPESIKEIREKLELSQNQFANLLGCTPESIRNWEHDRSVPAGQFIDLLYKICGEHGIDTPVFFKPGKKKRRRKKRKK